MTERDLRHPQAFETREQRTEALRRALIAGERSGGARELDMQAIKRAARRVRRGRR